MDINKGSDTENSTDEEMEDEKGANSGPTPNPEEDKNDYIDRCMIYPSMVGSYPNESERRSACASLWENSDIKSEDDEVVVVLEDEDDE